MFSLYYIKQGLIDVPHVVEECLARMLCNEEGVSTGTWQAVTWGGRGWGVKMAIFSVTYFLNDPLPRKLLFLMKRLLEWNELLLPKWGLQSPAPWLIFFLQINKNNYLKKTNTIHFFVNTRSEERRRITESSLRVPLTISFFYLQIR